MSFEMFDNATCCSIRMGSDSFHVRGGYVYAAFEVNCDFMVFSDLASRNSSIFESVVPTTLDDLVYTADGESQTFSFEADCFEGKIMLVLGEGVRLSEVYEQEALSYIADQMSVGWGTRGTFRRGDEITGTVGI